MFTLIQTTEPVNYSFAVACGL